VRIPKRLKIRRAIWDVEFDDSIVENEHAVGMCIRATKKILITPNMARNEIEETFLHELLHALFTWIPCSHRQEELIIARLSPLLYKALTNNNLMAAGRHEPKKPIKRSRKAG
jgi:hypothetical protein